MNQDLLMRIKVFLRSILSLNAYVDIQATNDNIRKNIAFKGPNVYILFFAVVIASVGLNVNSIPVIIGAMLISPLMGPIIGFGHGSMLFEEYAAQLVPVEVTAVHEHGIDFKTEDGARYIDWRAKIYDQHENELPLDVVRREFELEARTAGPGGLLSMGSHRVGHD